MLDLINTNKLVEEAASELASASVLAVDTEFAREKTYYPELCLIQIGAGKSVFLIDAVAKIDLAPIFEVLANRKALKIFHSCRQDVEILLQLSGKIPAPIFDTQVAAQFMGYKHSPSYETVARDFMEVELDKSSQFSNWKKRPLTDKQLEYAEAEVTHLLNLHPIMQARLEDAGKLGWFTEEMVNLEDEKIYRVNLEYLWKKISFRGATPRNMALIRELSNLREQSAIERNLPRQWVFKDEEITAITMAEPRDIKALLEIAVIQKQTVRKFGEAILGAVDIACSMPEDMLPKREFVAPTDNEKLSKLKLKLTEVAEEIKVQEPLISTVSELKKFLRNPATSALSKGWRFEAFGRKI